MSPLTITNTQARRLFLDRHALGSRPDHALTDDETLDLIRKLGFVQLDSVNAVERAHHMILFSRAGGYRRELLNTLHHDSRALFEHWTHDASLIPIEFYPHWHHRFRTAKTRIDHPRWRERFGPEPEKAIRRVRARIRKEGALSTRDFDDKGEGGWWGWGPSKTALEFLWRTGELAITRRDGFEKIYDHAERVIPGDLRRARPTRRQTIDWAAREALHRLGLATPQELAGFFDLIEIAEAKDWAKTALRRKEIIEVSVESADGSRRSALAFPAIEATLAALGDVPPAPRLLSPFDPAIRDRKRTLRLFGFDYTIEIFVPEKKRRYGYYVLPILEGTRFIGRADLKTHREEGKLEVKGFWPEPGVKLDKARKAAIEETLTDLARFTGVTRVEAGAPLRRSRGA